MIRLPSSYLLSPCPAKSAFASQVFVLDVRVCTVQYLVYVFRLPPPDINIPALPIWIFELVR